MKRLLVSMLASILLISACSPGTGIEVSKAWMRPAALGGNGAAYFLIQNRSDSADELTGASSDVAQTLELHESKMDGDVMQMQHAASVPIEENTSLEFEPGGWHVMLIGLNKDLKAGDEIQMTLHFRDHDDITVTVPVQELELDD
jgi:periplasmic copper chaperone A